MTRMIARLLLASAVLASTAPALARGHHGGGLFGFHGQHGHPINAWQGGHHIRLR